MPTVYSYIIVLLQYINICCKICYNIGYKIKYKYLLYKNMNLFYSDWSEKVKISEDWNINNLSMHKAKID